jgi:hypothetical protein
VRDDDYEPKRVLGIPTGTDPYARQGEEQRLVMGMPVGWFSPAGARIRSLKHPVRMFRRWRLYRRLGPYAPDDDNAA